MCKMSKQYIFYFSDIINFIIFYPYNFYNRRENTISQQKINSTQQIRTIQSSFSFILSKAEIESEIYVQNMLENLWFHFNLYCFPAIKQYFTVFALISKLLKYFVNKL